MVAHPRVTKQELNERRELVRQFMARGITREGALYQQKQLHDYYDGYSNPYKTIKDDIKAVKKENQIVAKCGGIDEALADYKSRLEGTLQECWNGLNHLNDTARVRMLDLIVRLSKDLAKVDGVDDETIQATMERHNIHIPVNIDNSTNNRLERLKRIEKVVTDGRNGNDDGTGNSITNLPDNKG